MKGNIHRLGFKEKWLNFGLCGEFSLTGISMVNGGLARNDLEETGDVKMEESSKLLVVQSLNIQLLICWKQ